MSRTNGQSSGESIYSWEILISENFIAKVLDQGGWKITINLIGLNWIVSQHGINQTNKRPKLWPTDHLIKTKTVTINWQRNAKDQPNFLPTINQSKFLETRTNLTYYFLLSTPIINSYSRLISCHPFQEPTYGSHHQSTLSRTLQNPMQTRINHLVNEAKS